VNATGQSVARGATLFTLYSPELYAAEQEYLIATQNRDAMRMSGDASHSERLARATETKLRLWGLGDDQLAALAKRGEPIERVPFPSPTSGVVVEKTIVDGAAVTAGQRLFRIADLADIWVEADVYESDLPRITKGMAASITLDYLPGKTFDGKVAFIYPYLDPMSRTGRVRIALPNKRLELKPDMYATVTFKLPLGPRLVVPIPAVVYTGPRRIVFVDLGTGALRPQEVTIGARSGDLIEITSGIKDGDVVVSSGNFLVAAESRVRSAGSFWEDSHGDK
jgi:membrane fusion protein, copper/silver efflux system